MYYIERKVGAGGTYAFLDTSETTGYTDDSPHIIGVVYYYRVKQVIDDVSSVWSNEVSVTYGGDWYRINGNSYVLTYR